METILIMAKALAKAASLDIVRLDIQYNRKYDEMSALCILGNTSLPFMETGIKEKAEFIIHEDGTIEIGSSNDDIFKIKYLKEWLFAMASNNEDYYDCIYDIIKRLPGFIEYAKDKGEGIYE